MEGQEKIIWDFSETAFRTGTLDKILDLIEVLTGKNTQTFFDAWPTWRMSLLIWKTPL